MPAWVPARTLIGHGPESIHLAEIRPKVEGFYQSSTSDQERLTMIRQYQISYIFDGPAEQALGSWSPDTFTSLSLSYQEENWKIYKVKGLSP
jgi:uncharacterized membrane protein